MILKAFEDDSGGVQWAQLLVTLAVLVFMTLAVVWAFRSALTKDTQAIRQHVKSRKKKTAYQSVRTAEMDEFDEAEYAQRIGDESTEMSSEVLRAPCSSQSCSAPASK